MSLPTIPVCDQCGKQKGPSNRWFILLESRRRFELFESSCPSDLIEPHEDDIVLDLCGEECVHKQMVQWMKKQG